MDILKGVLGLGMSAQVCSLEMTVLSSWKKAYIPSLEMSGSEDGGGGGEGRVETESSETVKEAHACCPPPPFFRLRLQGKKNSSALRSQTLSVENTCNTI